MIYQLLRYMDASYYSDSCDTAVVICWPVAMFGACSVSLLSVDGRRCVAAILCHFIIYSSSTVVRVLYSMMIV